MQLPPGRVVGAAPQSPLELGRHGGVPFPPARHGFTPCFPSPVPAGLRRLGFTREGSPQNPCVVSPVGEEGRSLGRVSALQSKTGSGFQTSASGMSLAPCHPYPCPLKGGHAPTRPSPVPFLLPAALAKPWVVWLSITTHSSGEGAENPLPTLGTATFGTCQREKGWAGSAGHRRPLPVAVCAAGGTFWPRVAFLDFFFFGWGFPKALPLPKLPGDRCGPGASTRELALPGCVPPGTPQDRFGGEAGASAGL